MEMVSIVAVLANAISKAVEVAPAVIKAGRDMAPFAELLWERIRGKTEVTVEEAAEIDNSLSALSARLQAPLPPAQADDI